MLKKTSIKEEGGKDRLRSLPPLGVCNSFLRRTDFASLLSSDDTDLTVSQLIGVRQHCGTREEERLTVCMVRKGREEGVRGDLTDLRTLKDERS